MKSFRLDSKSIQDALDSWPSFLVIPFFIGITLSNQHILATDGPKNQETYQQEIAQWRAVHEEKFRSPKGWLALVGHYWISEGDNAFGDLPSDSIQLPKISGLKARGIIRLNKNRVSIQVDDGAQVLVNGKSSSETLLAIDASETETDGSDSITVGERITMQLVRRNGRFAIRVRDSQSSLITSFKGKQWRAIDPKYRVEAHFTKFETPKIVKIVNIKGDETESKLVGRVEFTLDQQTLSLDALADSPTELFFIFKDRTCGKTSYGAGRFLDVTLEPGSEKIVLDFNKAYSPPCAYSPHTLCPLPPKQNQLDIAIEAGEMMNRTK